MPGALQIVELDATLLEKTKELIAEVVLEFYSDLDFLPKTKAGLLEHYRNIGYLQDLDAFASEYSESTGTFLVLLESENVVGCGGLRRLDANKGELVRLWMKKEARKKGYGLKIFLRLLESARKIGVSEIYLDTSRRCVDAVKLFRANGFQDCEKYKESIGDIFLRLKLL